MDEISKADLRRQDIRAQIFMWVPTMAVVAMPHVPAFFLLRPLVDDTLPVGADHAAELSWRFAVVGILATIVFCLWLIVWRWVESEFSLPCPKCGNSLLGQSKQIAETGRCSQRGCALFEDAVVTTGGKFSSDEFSRRATEMQQVVKGWFVRLALILVLSAPLVMLLLRITRDYDWVSWAVLWAFALTVGFIFHLAASAMNRMAEQQDLFCPACRSPLRFQLSEVLTTGRCRCCRSVVVNLTPK